MWVTGRWYVMWRSLLNGCRLPQLAEWLRRSARNRNSQFKFPIRGYRKRIVDNFEQSEIAGQSVSWLSEPLDRIMNNFM